VVIKLFDKGVDGRVGRRLRDNILKVGVKAQPGLCKLAFHVLNICFSGPSDAVHHELGGGTVATDVLGFVGFLC